ncbi:MAG: NADH-quinone oxidoreductase subunit NuoN [Pseudomonadota bacterium]
MTFEMPNLLPALPELFVLAAVCGILIVDVLLTDEQRFLTYILTQATLAGAAVITVAGAGDAGYTMNGMFVDDPMADVLKLTVYVAVSVQLVYSRDYLAQRGLFRGEFFSLALFAMLGMMVMISASHFLTLYLGLELLSLSLYAMVALQRDSATATEAAMKYFVLGALASGMLLYGMSMLYGATGSLNVAEVLASLESGAANRVVAAFGLVFVVAGLAFKLGVVPFHMWVPDVYHGAPTAMTLFIASAPKLAAFAFLMRILVEGLQPLFPDWQGMLIILALASMAVGNITAIVQTNLKRMLAYSTIAHMGFMLLGFLSGEVNGYSSAMFYVVTYVLTTLGTFGMIMLLSREGFEADSLEDFRGLNRRSPWYAFVMLILMFSLAGVPPTVGFFAKLAVLQAAVDAGLIWLAVAAVVLALIGAFYYLRIVKLMYFDEPATAAPMAPQLDARMMMGANALAVLALGILPQPLMALCVYAVQQAL